MKLKKMYYDYYGITHSVPKWLLSFRKKFYCSRNIHTFDEMESPERHILVCDACGLRVYINRIDLYDVDQKVLKKIQDKQTA